MNYFKIFIILFILFNIQCLPSKKLLINFNDYNGYSLKINKMDTILNIRGYRYSSNGYDIFIDVKNNSNKILKINPNEIILNSSNVEFDHIEISKTQKVQVINQNESITVELIAFIKKEDSFEKKLLDDELTLYLKGFSVNGECLEIEPIYLRIK
jgi:archaellum component FlaF (FlaF/FlaG flagellin family)